jgi:hypothetical protein
MYPIEDECLRRAHGFCQTGVGMFFEQARGGLSLVAGFCLLAPALGQQSDTKTEILSFGVEWRLVRAGEATLTHTGNSQSHLKLFSSGLVARLYRVEDDYKANYGPGHCIADSFMDAQEGHRHRETKITFDDARKRVNYLERDLEKDTVVVAKETDIPGCVHDVLGALHLLRTAALEPGQSWEVPISDGKKVVRARVECQEKEVVKTPLGSFPSKRYEALLFNGNFYGRKGRLFIWISDDSRHLPVQIRVQLPFYIGTVTVQLEKEERK